MSITFEQFLLSKHLGRANIYYCGGALVIYKPADNEGDDQYVLECNDNMVMIDQLHVLERRLYDDLGFEYQPFSFNGFNVFDPEHSHAGRGTHAGMIALMGDYCNFYGITARSADELAAEPTLHEWHHVWFQNYVTAWDEIPEVEIVAKPYKWVCGKCGEQAIYWDTSAYWNTETQKFEMRDGVDESDKNFCWHCGAENKGKKVEI
jgi:hypothetical protein